MNLTRGKDLCRKNGVDGYPQMNLYRNGKFVETFKQARTLEILTTYLDTHAEPRNPPAPTTSALQMQVTGVSQDELVAKAQNSREDVNPRGVVVSLDEHNFRSTVDKGDIFVKFFAPW